MSLWNHYVHISLNKNYVKATLKRCVFNWERNCVRHFLIVPESCTLASSVFVTFSTLYNLQTNSSASWNLDVVRSPSPRCWSSLFIWRIRSMPFYWCGQKSRRQCHNRLLRGKQEELSTVHRFREWKFLSDFMDGKVLPLLGRACLHSQLVALHAGEEDKK